MNDERKQRNKLSTMDTVDYSDREDDMRVKQEEEWKVLYEDIRIIANTYTLMVKLQISRIDEELQNDEFFIMRQFVDFEFLLVALFRLRRAACAIKRILIARATIQQAIENYDKRLPDLKKLRNISEHYDAYLLKQGKDDTIDRETIRSSFLTKCRLNATFEWMGYTMNLNECMTAAEELFLEIQAIRKLIS